MNKFYGRIYKLLAGFIRKLYRIEIVGKENEPDDGPFLVCANHISNQDVVILAASLKHQVRFLAKAELFKIPLLGRLIRALGAYPVERGKGDVGAIKNTLKLLDSGEVVGIYPQGHRYAGIHPSDSEVKGGVGLILTKKQIPVLPVAIQTKKFRVRILKKTKVIIGKPMYFDAPEEIVGKKNDHYNEISAAVFTNICSLLDKTAYPEPQSPKFLPEGEKTGAALLLREVNPRESEVGDADAPAKDEAALVENNTKAPVVEENTETSAVEGNTETVAIEGDSAQNAKDVSAVSPDKTEENEEDQ